MRNKQIARVLLHCLVWIAVFELESILYWTWNYWEMKDFQTTQWYNLSVYPVKIVGTYLFIYWLLPLLRRSRRHLWMKVLSVFVYLMVWLEIYRMVINFLTWPWLFGRFPEFNPLEVSLMTFSFIKLITPLPFILIIDGYYQQQNRQEQIRQLQKEKTEAELRFLKAQTHPHFLFNTLNNLYVLAKNKSEKTAPAIAKLSTLMRFMLYDSGQKSIPISKELQLITDYLELEKLRYDHRLKIHWDPQVDDPDKRIPPLLFLPFIENAFKHAASQSAGPISIDIRLKSYASHLEFSCSNPIVKPMQAEHQGVGLQNIRRRLNLSFPQKHALTISQEHSVFRVHLTITL